MRSTKTTVTITKKLLSDLLDESIFRCQQLGDDAKEIYLDDERDSLLKQQRETLRVIARATKAWNKANE